MKTIKYDKWIFFDKKVVGSARKLVKGYGVRYKSYAGEVLRRIHHYFFGDATNIRREYKGYYKKEFDNVDKFLECHLGIPARVRSRFERENVYYVNLDDKGDRVGESFSNDEGLVDQFWNIVGGMEDENSSGLRYEQFVD